MKIREEHITITRKIALGMYESIDPSITFVVEMEEGDTPVSVREELHAMAEAEFAYLTLRELKEVRRRRKMILQRGGTASAEGDLLLGTAMLAAKEILK